MERLLKRSFSGFTAHFTPSYAIKPLSEAIKYWAMTQARRSVSRMAAITFSIKQRHLLLSLLHQLSLSGVEGRSWKAAFLVLHPALAGGVGSLGCRTLVLGALTSIMLSPLYGGYPLYWVAWGRGGGELCCSASPGDLPVFMLCQPFLKGFCTKVIQKRTDPYSARTTF